jgi:hypothetical protein
LKHQLFYNALCSKPSVRSLSRSHGVTRIDNRSAGTGSAQDTWADGEPAVEYHAAINNPGALRTAFSVMMDNAGPHGQKKRSPAMLTPPEDDF